jgi:hypothetical protein
VVDIVAEAAKLQEAMARARVRVQEGGGDVGQGGVVDSVRADAEEETDRGGAGAAVQPEVGTGGGEAGSAAQPEAGEGRASGRAQEHPTGQNEEETPALEPPRVGVEGNVEEEPVPRVPVAEEDDVSEPTRVEDEEAAAAAEQMAVAELPSSSSEYGDSANIDPAAAASTLDKFVEFISASAETLCPRMFEELGDEEHGDEGGWAIVQSMVPSEPAPSGFKEGGDWQVIPSESDDAEREEEEVWEGHMTVGGPSRGRPHPGRGWHVPGQGWRLPGHGPCFEGAHFQRYGYAFILCFFTRFSIRSGCSPSPGRRMRS